MPDPVQGRASCACMLLQGGQQNRAALGPLHTEVGMQSKLIEKRDLKYLLDAVQTPIDEISTGQEVTIECEINCNGGVITSIDSVVRHQDIVYPYVNPLTGPITVKGAKKGQVLSVKILSMDLDPLGYSGLDPTAGLFPNMIWGDQAGYPMTRVMKIEDNIIHWDDTRRIPIAPMIGVLGVAPAFDNHMSIDNGMHGGNLDVQEIGEGAVVHLPINHDGALLYIGDCHARQGDGEISGMGPVEVAARVTLVVETRDRPKRMTWPRFETATHIGTIACAKPLEDAMRLSYREMIYWLADEYGLTEPDAYMFLGTVAEGRATQLANPKSTYVCKVAKHLV